MAGGGTEDRSLIILLVGGEHQMIMDILDVIYGTIQVMELLEHQTHLIGDIVTRGTASNLSAASLNIKNKTISFCRLFYRGESWRLS